MPPRGRARPPNITFMMSVDPTLADRLDAVGDRLEGRPSRQEVVRRILIDALPNWESTTEKEPREE